MKKTMLRLALVLTLLCTAAFALKNELKEAIVNKIMTIKANDFITNELFAKVINQRKYVYDDGIAFDGTYQDCRDTAYETLFNNKEVLPRVEGQIDWNLYVAYRTITVATFKKQLHTGDTLKEVYNKVRNDFKKAVAIHSKTDRKGLIRFLERASSTFGQIDKPEYREAIENGLKKTSSDNLSDEFVQRSREALTKNLSPEETLKIIGKPPVEEVSKPQTEVFDHDGLQRFALRRWKEGGQSLTGKYYIIVRLALADAKEADASSTVEE